MNIPRANLETVRNWNATFPVGHAVIFEGREYRTWSHAGIGGEKPHAGRPVVLLDGGPDAPVLLDSLQIPGYETQVVDRRKRPNARPEAAA